MPLKRSYQSEADIPTEQKGFYVQKGDRWELQVEGVDSLDGLLSKRSELLTKVANHDTQIAAKDTRIAELEGQLANASTVPRGQEAVPKADAELARAVKAAGIADAAAFATLKTEHGDYKSKAEEAEKAKHAAEVGGVMQWDKEKTGLLVPAVFDLSQVQLRDGQDGKKEAVAKVKQADGSFVEKPFAEVIKSTPALTALLPSLTAQKQPDGTELPEHGAGGGGGKASPADAYFASVDSAPKARQAQA